MKKYLITGGCGFIGQHLAKRLLKTKCIIDLIDLPKKNLIKSSRIKLFKADISNYKILKNLNQNTILLFI